MHIFNFKLECVDNAGWSDPLGDDCKEYEKFCENGNAKPGFEDYLDEFYNNPEENCCACGKPIPRYTWYPKAYQGKCKL